MKVPLSADFIQNNASGSVQVGKSGYIIVLFQKVITTFEKFFLFWVPINGILEFSKSMILFLNFWLKIFGKLVSDFL